MASVNIFDAKTNLSKYISSIEEKKEPYIIIMRNGKPVAKIVPYEETRIKKIGIAKDELPKLTSIEEFNSINLENEFLKDGNLL